MNTEADRETKRWSETSSLTKNIWKAKFARMGEPLADARFDAAEIPARLLSGTPKPVNGVDTPDAGR